MTDYARLKRHAVRCAAGTAVLVAVAASLVAVAASAALAQARAKIAWQSPGAYEACLEMESDNWLMARAEDLVSGDESVKSLDDTTVAMVSISVMKTCAPKGSPGHAGNEDVFVKHMAHWRQHLYEMAKVVRSKGGFD